MIAIKKILVPTDLLDSSLPAIGYALSLARNHAAEVCVLHVLPNKSIREDFSPGYLPGGLVEAGTIGGATPVAGLDSVLERKRRIVNDFVQQRIASELLKPAKVSALVRFGKPMREIVAAAKEEQADLIVMNRRTGLALGGHLSDRIIKQAPCPVLTMQPSAEIRTEQNERVPLNHMQKWAA